MDRVRNILWGLFAVALVVSISGALLLGAILLLDWFIQIAQKRSTFVTQGSPLVYAVAAYAIWGIFVSIVNGSLRWWEVLNLQTSLLLFFLFSNRKHGDKLSIFIRWFLFASFFVGFLACVQFCFTSLLNAHGSLERISTWISEWPKWADRYFLMRFGRANGTRSHPITFAESFIPAIFLSITLLIRGEDLRRRFGISFGHLVVGFIWVVSGVFFSQTRGVWLGSLIGGVILLFLKENTALRKWGIIALVGFFLIGLGAPSLRGRFLSIFSNSHGSQSDQDSKRTRYVLWNSSMDSIRTHPILGVGLKGAKFDIVDVTGVRNIWSESHNMYLQSMVDMGVMGIILLVILWGLFGWRFFTMRSSWRGAFLGMFIAFVVGGMTESWMGDRTIAMIFWSFMGIGEFYAGQGKSTEKDVMEV